MKAPEDIESFLLQMDVQYDVPQDNMWVVKGMGPEVVVVHTDPVLAFRVKVIDLKSVPEGRRPDLFRTLLELNSGEMLHGAYGLEQGAVVATAALQLENLDFNEFQATIDDLVMAVTKHYPRLSKLAA